MKNLTLALTAFVLTTFASMPTARAAEFGPPTLIAQEPENVFTPQGFDNNDNAQLVVHGMLSDSCHKAGPVDVTVDHDKKTVRITNYVYLYSGCWCAEVITPFTQTVDLGVLKTGEYRVLVDDGSNAYNEAGKLPIAMSASQAADDYLYAPIEDIYIDGKTVTLRGTFTNTCMRMKDVKVNYRTGNVLEVLPIAELDDTACQRANVPFKATFTIKESAKGRALIHVRSLNGKSINRVIEL